mmetsp:Transcript_24404/g.62975  ORF Transcript_24404/g.62975 Transcript_24404/m.62975 type:complete len:256 (+) Transcript_24404:122-889(+)
MELPADTAGHDGAVISDDLERFVDVVPRRALVSVIIRCCMYSRHVVYSVERLSKQYTVQSPHGAGCTRICRSASHVSQNVTEHLCRAPVEHVTDLRDLLVRPLQRHANTERARDEVTRLRQRIGDVRHGLIGGGKPPVHVVARVRLGAEQIHQQVTLGARGLEARHERRARRLRRLPALLRRHRRVEHVGADGEEQLVVHREDLGQVVGYLEREPCRGARRGRECGRQLLVPRVVLGDALVQRAYLRREDGGGQR